MYAFNRAFRPAASGALFLCIVLSSCSARIDATLRADGSAEARVSASIEARTAALIRNLSGLSGVQADRPVLDAAALSASLRASPAVRSAALRNIDDRRVSGILSIGDFRLLASDSAARGSGSRPFVLVEKVEKGGAVHVHLDRTSAGSVLTALSPEIGEYLEALMAPAATGEELTKSEYLSLVSSVYGSSVSAEIASAELELALTLPLPASSVTGGRISGGIAEFTIPLVDLLVLEKPIDLSAVWK